MGWIKLDDALPDHPRVEEVVPEAMWLYVAGLCYCNRAKTDGVIRKARIPKLTFLPKPERLMKSLIGVGLWEDHGESIHVFNYLKFQRSAEQMDSQVSAGRHAAKARWAHAKGDADRIPTGNAESHAPVHEKGNTEKRREEKRREEEPKRARRAQLPENFQPDETGTRLCRELSLDLPSELSKFSDHHKSKGTLMLDWQAAWRTWIKRSQDFAASKPQNGHKPYRNAPEEAYFDTAI